MLSCNGCKNRNTYACVGCVGWNRYVSDATTLHTLAMDIDKEMKMLAKAGLNNLFGIKNVERKTDMRIKKVIFNYPATVVIWEDGTKTIVKAGDYDVFDPEKGLAMAIAKKALGNQGNYYEVFKKWLPEEKEEEELSPLGELKQALANLTIPKLSIAPIVKRVKATNIGDDGILVEGELTKTGEKFFEKISPESSKPSIDETTAAIKEIERYEEEDKAPEIQWLSTKQVADMNNISVECVRKQIKDGLIPSAEKVDGKWRIPCYVFDDYVEVVVI